jgi:NAD(P)-dependent dehydrogenase (short-subunit alcohol dehydrogenase family)
MFRKIKNGESIRLFGKVAIVTGGSGTLGRSIVEEFFKEGSDVVLTYFVDKKNADMLVSKARIYKRKCFAIKCDVRNINDIKNVVNTALQHFKKVDILINNAGVADNVSLENITEDIWNNVIDTDLKGPFYFCKLISSIMKKQGYGKIINISSIGGIKGTYNQASFGAAKSGLIGFTRSLGIELAHYNINVNAIAPGVIETENKPKEEYRKIANIIPIKKVGKPIDIARMAVFLASSDSDFIVGQTFIVDGGHSNAVFYDY